MCCNTFEKIINSGYIPCALIYSWFSNKVIKVTVAIYAHLLIRG